MINTCLLEWFEFGKKSAPSIQTVFESTPYPEMERIIDYLENGRVCLAAPGEGVDMVTGKTVMLKKEIHSDGEYCWSSMLPYYVKEYNMRLPKAFEDKVFGHENK